MSTPLVPHQAVYRSEIVNDRPLFEKLNLPSRASHPIAARITSSGAEIAFLIDGTLCGPSESRSCHTWPAASPMLSLDKTWRVAASRFAAPATLEFVALDELPFAIGEVSTWQATRRTGAARQRCLNLLGFIPIATVSSGASMMLNGDGRLRFSFVNLLMAGQHCQRKKTSETTEP
jgi:hypothetical protein